MRVLIACGGTGGHLFPGLAVAAALLDRKHEVQLLVSEKAVDQRAVARLPVAVTALPAIGFTGVRKLPQFCWRLAQATRDCRAVCREFRPHAVLGMGGFTSAPALAAAQLSRRCGTLIHESNAIPGKANRWAGRFADQVAVGLADCARFFGKTPVTVTGTPLRAQLRGGRVANAREQLGLDRHRLTVLVIGGSQGARGLNEATAAALPVLAAWTERTQFVHLSGAKDEAVVRAAYDQHGFAATVMGFCTQMELAYSAADVVIARSGAGTLTEIAAFGLPAILMPYPQAAGNHQLFNARVFERAGAACVIEQSHGAQLGPVISELLDDADRRATMAAAAQSLAVIDADQRVASLVEQYAD